jgi:hypothetical protein
MRLSRVAVLLALLGAALVLIGVGVGAPTPTGVEGAYFTRASGTPAYSGVFTGSGLSLLDTGDGNLWLGAGIVCCLQAVALALIAAWRSRTSLPATSG